MEIIPQVHLVPLTRGANVYLIEEAALTLVDAGFPHSEGAIIRYIENLGRRPQDLARIVLTHRDVDHAGSAAELKVRTGAEIMSHAGDTSESSWREVEGFRGFVALLHEGQS